MDTMQSLHQSCSLKFLQLCWAQLSTSMDTRTEKRLVCLNDQIQVEGRWLLVLRNIISQNLRHKIYESVADPQEEEKSREDNGSLQVDRCYTRPHQRRALLLLYRGECSSLPI